VTWLCASVIAKVVAKPEWRIEPATTSPDTRYVLVALGPFAFSSEGVR
jgi:hypothetical protein